MDPILIIFLIIAGVFVGFMIGLLAGILLGRLRRTPQTPPPSVSEMRASPNFLCFNENCFTLLSYEIANPSQEQINGGNIQLTTRKNGDEERRIVQDVELTTSFSRPFASTDTRVFYDGPGRYSIGLHLLPSATTAPNREVSVVALAEERPILNILMSADTTNNLINSVSASRLFADVENEKANIRVCKGTKIVALTLRRVLVQPSGQIDEDLWQTMRENDGLENVQYPDAVDFQFFVNQNSIWTGILRVDETVFFGTDVAGNQNPSLPNAIDIVQSLALSGNRQSENNPFPRFSDVGWQIALQVSCL